MKIRASAGFHRAGLVPADRDCNGVIADRQSPKQKVQKNTARFRALGSTRHLAVVGTSAGTTQHGPMGFLANPLLAKGLRQRCW
jgi:hypothetical protein